MGVLQRRQQQGAILIQSWPSCSSCIFAYTIRSTLCSIWHQHHLVYPYGCHHVRIYSRYVYACIHIYVFFPLTNYLVFEKPKLHAPMHASIYVFLAKHIGYESMKKISVFLFQILLVIEKGIKQT